MPKINPSEFQVYIDPNEFQPTQQTQQANPIIDALTNFDAYMRQPVQKGIPLDKPFTAFMTPELAKKASQTTAGKMAFSPLAQYLLSAKGELPQSDEEIAKFAEENYKRTKAGLPPLEMPGTGSNVWRSMGATLAFSPSTYVGGILAKPVAALGETPLASGLLSSGTYGTTGAIGGYGLAKEEGADTKNALLQGGISGLLNAVLGGWGGHALGEQVTKERQLAAATSTTEVKPEPKPTVEPVQEPVKTENLTETPTPDIIKQEQPIATLEAKEDNPAYISWQKRQETIKKANEGEELTPEESRDFGYTHDKAGLYNTAAYKRWLKEDETLKDQPHLYMDLDNFKKYNDAYGHDFGDTLIKYVGERISKISPTERNIGLGGDEFAIVHQDKDTLNNIAESLKKDLANATFEVRNTKTGEMDTVTGLRLSHGIGKDFKDAKEVTSQEKEAKLLTGERYVRGQERKGKEFRQAPVAGRLTKTEGGIRNNGDNITRGQEIPVEQKEPTKPSRTVTFQGTAGIDTSIPIHEQPKAKALNRIHQGLGDMTSSASTVINNTLLPIDHELAAMSPEIHRAATEFERVNLEKQTMRIDHASEFIKDMAKVAKEKPREMETLSEYLLNGNFDGARKIISRLGVKDFDNAIGVYDGLIIELQKLHPELQKKPNYWNRKIKDYQKFSKEVIGSELWERKKNQLLQDAEKKKQAEGKGSLTPEEHVQLIGDMLASYKGNGTNPGFLKQRKYSEIPKEWLQYYEAPHEALISYIQMATEHIEKHNMVYGRKEGGIALSDDASIAKLVMDNKITPRDVKRFTELMESRFNYKETKSFVQATKDLGYLSTMSDIQNGLTQIGDVGMSMYDNGLFNAAMGLAETVKPPVISAKELGLGNLINEISRNKTKLGEITAKVLTQAGVTGLDLIGKQTYINSSMRLFKQQAYRKDPKFLAQLNDAFGENAAQALEDCKKGINSAYTRSLVFYRATSYYPATRLQYPKAYLDHPNANIVYNLHIFQLRQFHKLRREIEAGFKDNPVEGLKKFITAAMILGSMQYGVQALKGWMLGDQMNEDEITLPFSDIHVNKGAVNAVAGIFGFSTYNLEKMRQDGWGGAVGGFITPPIATPFNYIGHDLTNMINGQPPDKVLALFPWIGNSLHAYFDKQQDLFGGLIKH